MEAGDGVNEMNGRERRGEDRDPALSLSEVGE